MLNAVGMNETNNAEKLKETWIELENILLKCAKELKELDYDLEIECLN